MSERTIERTIIFALCAFILYGWLNRLDAHPQDKTVHPTAEVQDLREDVTRLETKLKELKAEERDRQEQQRLTSIFSGIRDSNQELLADLTRENREFMGRLVEELSTQFINALREQQGHHEESPEEAS